MRLSERERDTENDQSCNSYNDSKNEGMSKTEIEYE